MSTSWRTSRAAIWMACLLLVPACGSEDSGSVPIGADPNVGSTSVVQTPMVAPEASHAGRVVRVGNRFAEVLGFTDGELDLFLRDDPGAPRPDTVSLTVVTSAGERPVILTWDPSRECYRGTVYGTELVPGPFTVTLASEGVRQRGSESPLPIRARAASVESPEQPAESAEEVSSESQPVESEATPAPARTRRSSARRSRRGRRARRRRGRGRRRGRRRR